MRLIELELENWGRHGSLKIDLSGGLQIGGRNGTGKSSILEAIRFIFSESSRGYNGKIRKGADHARVKLRLSKDKDAYSIEKRLFPKKPSTAIMWVNRNPVADNSSTVYAKVQEIIREDLLDKLIYVPQGSMTEIVRRLGVKGGRQEFDRLFGLDRLEKVYAGINDEIKTKDAQYTFLVQEISRYPKDAAQGYDTEIKALELGVKAGEKKLETDRRDQHILEQKVEQLEKKLSDLRQLKKLKDELEKKINLFKIEEEGFIKDLGNAKDNLKTLSEKRKEVEKLDKDAESLKKYAGMRDLIRELETDESKLKSIGNLDAKKKLLDDAETELNKKYNLEMEFESMGKKIDDLNKKTAVLRERVSQKNSFLRELSSLSGKAACPKCGQSLGANHVAAERKSTEEEIHKLEKDLKEYSFLLVTEQKKKEPLVKQLKELRNLEAESKQRKEDCEKAVKEKEKISEALEKIRAELKKAGHSGETSREVNEKAWELQKIEGKILALKGDIAGEKSFEQKIMKAEMRLGDLWAKKEDLEKQAAKLIYDEKLLLDLERRRDEIKEQKNKSMVEIEKLHLQAEENKRKIKDLEEKKKEYLEIEKKEKELARDVALMREARDIFHTDKGMIKYLREKYIRQLSMLLTQYFRRINQNPRYRDILFDKDYELEIKTKEGSFSVEQLSGGELVQIALALRMALLELLSPVRLLILDEPFGSLDKEHREALGEALNKIGGEGQLIIVTHIPVDSLQLPELELGGY